MPSEWLSPVFAVCVLGLLLPPGQAHAEPLPGPNLCLRSLPDADQGPALTFGLPSPLDWNFRDNSTACGGILDSILGRGPWARAAGTAAEAGRLMLGLNLDLKSLTQFARSLGILTQAPELTVPAPQELQVKDELEVKTHTSFVLRASRKRMFLGFGFQW